MKRKTTSKAVSAPLELTEYQRQALKVLGEQFIKNFDSFDAQDCVRYGRMTSASFSYEMLMAWSREFIQELVKSNKAVLVWGCYEEPIVRVIAR